ncbi:DUF4214 domain-containing protein [Massilia dura]|uniref:DUF4214 domain-containing protein n=1 Tax=Pseudoduganella dura TaxID=321982 RepID=A0A6I3XGZ1_9BURK|nr:DUF4214 domain-containing protein [Pseudoduganella dura]MUI11948.1 DUF4214 domain-containing protein [Pseudoduganella dura]GGY13617.1 hypothetical protein GCM10007386_49880 [Pseudoduganella dura]
MSMANYPTEATTVGSLANGGRFSSTIATVGEMDWIRLELDPDDAYRFTATTAAGTEQAIYIIDRAQPDWPLSTNVTDHFTYNPLANPYTYIQPGHQYFLRVDSAIATAYTIGMTAAADDYGNSSASARVLAAGGTADAFFDYAGDREHYSVSATAGLTYTVTVTADTMEADAWLRAFNDRDATYSRPDGGNAYGGQGGTTVTMSFLATETRVYDITVGMPSYSTPASPVHYQVAVSAADKTGPAVVSATSTIDGPIRITFDEGIRLGSGTISLDGTTWDIASAAVSIDGNTLTLKPGFNLMPYRNPIVSISASALTDLTGNIRKDSYSEGNHTTVKVDGVSDGNLVGSSTGDYLGSTLQGTNGALDVAIYGGKPGDYTFTIGNGKVEVSRPWSSYRDLLIDVERVYFSKSADVMAFSLDGDLGQLYRLYQAAFDRTPDKAGLGYWTGLRDDGMALHAIAREFIASKEFTDLYGANSSNAAFVEALYENALHRPGEAAGVTFWTGALDQGVDRASVLIGFSESAENQQLALGTLGNGFSYTPYG